MTLRLVEYLANQNRYDITSIASAMNSELCRRLSGVLPHIKVIQTPYTSGRGQWLRTYFSIKPLLRLWAVRAVPRCGHSCGCRVTINCC